MNALVKVTLSISWLFLLPGCGNEVDHSKIKKSGFVYCGQENPTTFNPQLVDSGITAETLSPQIFDTLLTIDPDTHQPVASVAKQWLVNNNGTEYTFILRDDVPFQTTAWFSPSRNLNADDVVFSFDRIINPNNPYHNIGHSNYPWFSGTNFIRLISSIRAVDAHTVKFTLRHPDNSFLANVSTTHAVIHSSEYAQQLSERGEQPLLDSHPVGSGPFALEEFQSNDYIRLIRNEHYWKGAAKMAQVVFDVAQRGTGTVAKLLRNECDVLSTPISSQIPVIEQQDQISLNATPAMNVAFIAINTTHPIINDPKVRRALNYAINRDNILDSVYYGTGSIAYSLLPPNSTAYRGENSQVRFSPFYAKTLLRQVGITSHIELNMLVPEEPTAYNPSPRKTAELIQANFKAIGVTLHLISQEHVDRVRPANRLDIDLFLTGWSGRTADPDNYLRPLLSCESQEQGINLTQWCSPQFDSLLDAALITADPNERVDLYKQAQTIMTEAMPIIPLTHGMQFKAYNDSLTGFKLSPFNAQPFDAVERKN
jgi:cationic peptide transport system substrate-binding protein